MKVPMNKVVIIGSRRFCEGEALPPGVFLEMPEMSRAEAEDMFAKLSEKRAGKKE